MTNGSQNLQAFLAQQEAVIHVFLTKVAGSSPRERGAEMLVSQAALWGTIGGGQLEYIAIDRARQMLRSGEETALLDVQLGPEINQCCGGRVDVSFSKLDKAAMAKLQARYAEQRKAQPHIYIFGAGHVGRALAEFLQYLPVHTVLIDSRGDELARSSADVKKRQSALPEEDVRSAPSGSAFIIATHDHNLDFLISASALARDDASYVGMIGSKTKRAKFEYWCNTNEPSLETSLLVSPIGASKVKDKRPSVIAAFVTAELMTRISL